MARNALANRNAMGGGRNRLLLSDLQQRGYMGRGVPEPGFSEGFHNLNALQKAGLVLNVPGVAGDVQELIQDPESRNWINYTAMGVGAIPLAGGALKQGVKALARSAPADVPMPNITEGKPAQLAEGTSRRISTTGKYRGAPQGVKSPQKLAAMRKRLTERLVEGAPGRLWYDRSSEVASDLAGGRPGVKARYTGTMAITSRDAAVPANQVFGVRGYNQALQGDPVSAGRRPNLDRPYIEDLFAGNPVAMGNKREPFYQAQNIVPGQTVRPTNDVWMARAFDYRKDGKVWSEGLGDAQHRFMDDEITNLVKVANEKKLGGFDDWTPERVQAAIWVSEKSRAEKIPIARAAKDFSDDLDKLTARIAVESEPAAGLNHLPGVRSDPAAANVLADAQRNAMSDPQGRDLLALHSGALTRPTTPGSGYYKGRSTPADAVNVLAAPGTGSARIDPSSERLTRGIAAGHGLVRGQESVGFNFLRPAARAADRNAAQIDIGRTLNEAEMTALGGKLDHVFDGAIIPTHTDTGVALLVIDDVPAGWEKQVQALAKQDFGVKAEFGVNSGDLVGSFEGYKPSAYLPDLEAAVAKTPGLETGLRDLAPALEAVDEALVREIPNVGARSEMLQLVRQTLADQGLAGIRRLVDQGALPAVVLSVVGGLAAGSQPGQQPAPDGVL